MDIELFKKIGLTEGETKVYLALLKLGQSTTGPIVRKAGVTTSKSYKILDRLEEKGLTSHIIKKKMKYFKAASPKKILEIFEKQSKEFNEKKKEIERAIPELISYTNKLQKEPEAEVYYGIEGLETLFNQQVRELKRGENNYVIGITHIKDYGEQVANFFRHLQKERDKKGIISNFLLGENAKGSFDYMEKSKFCNLKYLPYSSLVSINVHKETSIIGVFVGGNPILFKISSKEVADTFKEYFELLWKQAK
jgi:predicted transcriptional regulator